VSRMWTQRSVRRNAQTVKADESSRAAFLKISAMSFAARPMQPTPGGPSSGFLLEVVLR
jgi:hypothetical protein